MNCSASTRLGPLTSLLRLSEFSLISRYPELRELELRQLARLLLSSNSRSTLQVLMTKIRSYARGGLSHAEHILPALYELMENETSVEEAPLPAAATSNRQVTNRDWEGLKRALTTSLTSGTFLDSQFYAVESKSSTGSPRIRPVYFCSMAGGSFASALAACGSPVWMICMETSLIVIPDCSKLRARRYPLPQRSDGYDSDMGDEGSDQESLTVCYPRLKWFVDPLRLPTYRHELSSLQDSGEPYTHKLAGRARASVEVWGGKDVGVTQCCERTPH